MESQYFHFKKFEVNQAGAAHPVGTDGILLGAWAPLPAYGPYLDIGCGSGLIALMLAQRSRKVLSPPEIHAIDIQEASAQCARSNFFNSPWKTRIQGLHKSVQDFKPGFQYPLIVSNPPFFTETVLSPDESRSKVRSTLTLSHEELLLHADRLLAPEGTFCLILPPEQAERLIEMAGNWNLHLVRITKVRSRHNKPVKRYLMAFSRNEEALKEEELVLYDSGTSPSPAFQQLGAAFYLNW